MHRARVEHAAIAQLIAALQAFRAAGLELPALICSRCMSSSGDVA